LEQQRNSDFATNTVHLRQQAANFFTPQRPPGSLKTLPPPKKDLPPPAKNRNAHESAVDFRLSPKSRI
jgi:hypothetical protein